MSLEWKSADESDSEMNEQVEIVFLQAIWGCPYYSFISKSAFNFYF